MRYIIGLIGCIFIVIALAHAPLPTPLSWLPYLCAAGLAFTTLKNDIRIPLARILAVCTVLAMFFFFAAFFVVVPKLEADWYMHQTGWSAVSLILGAFLMLPILSNYSCILKADCRDARVVRRRAFFSVPHHIPRHH
jgi:hypothetical protein